MGTVVLISCVSRKLQHRARARELYTSTLFRLNLAYAESLKPKRIFVLSAKYGVVGLDDEIDPYDMTLNQMSEGERREWASRVLQGLRQTVDVSSEDIIFLAGLNYRKHLIPHLARWHAPLAGLGIGKQLHFLKERLYG